MDSRLSITGSGPERNTSTRSGDNSAVSPADRIWILIGTVIVVFLTLGEIPIETATVWDLDAWMTPSGRSRPIWITKLSVFPLRMIGFVLTNPAVDICMMGARDLDQMRENLKTLDMGPMSEDELNRMRRIGDHIYRKQ